MSCQLCTELENCCVMGSKVGPNPNPDYAFIGEAPGEVEAKEGRPFVAPQGSFSEKHYRN